MGATMSALLATMAISQTSPALSAVALVPPDSSATGVPASQRLARKVSICREQEAHRALIAAWASLALHLAPLGASYAPPENLAASLAPPAVTSVLKAAFAKRRAQRAQAWRLSLAQREHGAVPMVQLIARHALHASQEVPACESAPTAV